MSSLILLFQFGRFFVANSSTNATCRWNLLADFLYTERIESRSLKLGGFLRLLAVYLFICSPAGPVDGTWSLAIVAVQVNLAPPLDQVSENEISVTRLTRQRINFLRVVQKYRKPVVPIDMSRISRPPTPLVCRLCPIWSGCQRCPPRKEEQCGKGVK
jgi:hypothetical protein